MELSLKELLNGSSVQLRYVKRYAIFNCINPESVAEHSFYTVLYCLFVGEWAREHGTSLDIGKLLTRAVLHDLEEARTGDILRMFKHRSASLTKAINRVGEEELADALSAIVIEDTDSVAPSLVAEWKWAKDSTPEGRVMAFADFLSVLSYLMQELQFTNESRVPRTDEFRQYLGTFYHPSFEFIRPLINQACSIIHELFGVQVDD
jgi:5'-deoxynucleotidase YfbR-like HD superfamily hydrolase